MELYFLFCDLHVHPLLSPYRQQSGNSMEADVPGNPVGELQEFTQKKLIKPPIYEFGNEEGPPHNREFVCTVKLGKFTEKGAIASADDFSSCLERKGF